MCWPCYRLDALHRKQKLHAVRVLSVSEVIDQTPNEEAGLSLRVTREEKVSVIRSLLTWNMIPERSQDVL
jgi:hypothetical protein